MTPDQVLEALARATAHRKEAEAAAAKAEAVERAFIADAWRAGHGPKAIAETADRSEAHVRKLRPADVPPRRTGGGAAKPRRKRATTARK